MTDFERIIQLFINGAMGIKTNVDASFEIDALLSLAQEHNMYYSVLSAILMCNDEELGLSAEKSAKLREDLKNTRLRTYVRMMHLYDILKQFENENIPYALLKGNTVAVLYSDPCSRISGDVDLLINPKDEKRASELLLKNGFIQQKIRMDDDKHGILVHPVIGMLELHISLYNENTGEVWFNDAKDHFDVEIENFSFEDIEKVQIDDMYFYTLEINKRIEYLFLHNVKHFILGGSSIRAVMDFFLTYINCPGIDYSLFYEKVKRMKFETVFNVMITSVEKFLDMDKIDVPYYKKCGKELVKLFFEDMENGKWLGYGADGKTDGSWQVFEETKKKNKKKSKINTFLRYVFPPVKRLKNNYKYSMRHPVLLPIAWFHRLIRVCLGKTKLEKVGNSNRTRVELLKTFGLTK